MAKKTANPADAFRKAQRKKELKKNKTERSKKRDFSLVKKDTWEQQDEIAKLKALKELTPTDAARLSELEAELQKINAKKEEYIKEHPEHRRLVYRPRPKEGDAPAEEVELPTRKLFKKNGLPRHPERSVYYDAVMNPFGVAPPGMPYMERPLRPDEVDSEEEMDEDDDDDDDILMPPGPPPVGNEEEVDSEDDIPMPDGPPPGQAAEEELPLPQTQSYPSLPPFPPPFPPMGHMPYPPPPPFPPGVPHGAFPMPPPGPPPFPPSGMAFPLPPGPPPFLPSGPPGFFPRHQQPAPHDSLPHHSVQVLPRTSHAPTRPRATDMSAATVFAAPELRDFKKEATSFVPAALKRKKPVAATPGSATRINAAPSLTGGEDTETVNERPDLMSVLQGQLGFSTAVAPADPKMPAVKKKDESYENFMAEMGDLLK